MGGARGGGKNGLHVDLPHPKFLEAALATSLVELPVDPVDGIARHYQTFFQIEGQTLPTLATTLYLLDHGVEVPEQKLLTRQSFEDVWPTGIDLDSSGRFYINYQAPPFKIGSEHNPLRVFPASAVLTGLFWFFVKAFLVIFVYLWLRATFPRYRYDRLMRLGWKWLIPLGLIHVMVTGFAVLMKG